MNQTGFQKFEKVVATLIDGKVDYNSSGGLIELNFNLNPPASTGEIEVIE